MKKKKTTIHDIAKELDITASTVSRALQDHPRISDATKKAVTDMSKKLNYQPNSIATALRKGKSNILGVIVPRADRFFFASIIKGIEQVVNEAGYNVMICQSNDTASKEELNIESLLNTRVDGILSSIAMDTEDFTHYKKIIEKDIPLVLYDRVNDSINASEVVIDDYQGAYKATEHLIEQGCKNIAHFAGSQIVSIYKERFRGYKQALRDNNLPVRDDLVIQSDLQLEAGRKSTKKLLTVSPPPDGIFSASDFAAMGAMQVLKKHRINIPEEVAIIGFSNEPFTAFVEPALSTVDQHSEEIGKSAARLFLDQVKSGNNNFIPRKTVLKADLIIRASSNRQ